MQFNNSLFKPTDHLLVAFSGGPDSVSCLHYLVNSHDTSKLSAFYLHHGLREEADAEVAFCKSFCDKLGVTFYTDKVDISKLAHEQKKSLEQVGREVRYTKLAEIARNIEIQMSNDQSSPKGYDMASKIQTNHKPEAPSPKPQALSLKPQVIIVTAHHLDDQVESVLMQIFSGTSGLRIGIADKLEINGVEVIRPLLHDTKETILNYCEDNSLEYVTDGSNLENDFKRNKLRNIIIPMIRQTMNPQLEKAIERYKDISDEMSSYLDDQLTIIQESLSVGNAYDLRLFLKIHPFLQKEFLKRLLVNNDILVTTGLLEEMLSQLNGGKPNIKYLINKDMQLVKEYAVFKITTVTEKEGIFCPLSYGENEVGDKQINIYLDTMCVVDKLKKTSVCLDADKVDIGSLLVRNKELGDAFIPLGMKGTKKLKDYFIDKKVPTTVRDEVLVVEHVGGIVWVVGYEIDDRVKVTEETKSFLVIEVLEG